VTLEFFVDQTGKTCWRLTSAQYFVSKAEAEAALAALVAASKDRQP